MTGFWIWVNVVTAQLTLAMIWLHVRHIDHEISKPPEEIITQREMTPAEWEEFRQRGLDQILHEVAEETQADADFGYPRRPDDAA